MGSPIGDIAKAIAKNTVGKLMDGVIGRYLPKTMPEGEKAQVALEVKKLVQQEIETNSEVIESINATMRAEAKSDHWAQWLWRPVVGFTFSATIINNYILMPYFNVTAIDIPPGIWQAMLIVLGVAAGTRGLEKWQREKRKRIDGPYQTHRW